MELDKKTISIKTNPKKENRQNRIEFVLIGGGAGERAPRIGSSLPFC